MASSSSKGRPPAALNNAVWRTSKAKQLVAQDIIDGEIPAEGDYAQDEVFERLYKDHAFFVDFPYDYEHYKARIDRLRKAVTKLKHWSQYDSAKVLEDLVH
jgi:hypothetical protein